MIQSDPRITTPENPPPPPHCLVFGSKMIRITHPENPPPPPPCLPHLVEYVPKCWKQSWSLSGICPPACVFAKSFSLAHSLPFLDLFA